MFELLSTTVGPQLAAPAITDFLSSTWNIVLIILGFSVVVFFHELGHFAVAKWADVRVERFAVGFGPEMFGITRGETRYSFNVLPLGGYVKMLGQEDFEVDTSGELLMSDDPRAFSNKPVGRRMAVVSAGVIMNLLVAAVLFMIVYMIGREEVVPMIGELIPEYPAAKAGMQVGDRVVKINETKIDNYNQILAAVRLADPYEELEFTIERDGEFLTKSIQPKVSELNLLQVGFLPAFTTKIEHVDMDYLQTEGPHPQKGDIIRQVNGTPVKENDGLRALELLLQGRQRPSEMIVARQSETAREPQKLDIEVHKIVSFVANGYGRTAPAGLLGLLPRIRITQLDTSSDSPAHLAGFEIDDVLIKWGGIVHPTVNELLESVRAHIGQDIPVHVRREGMLLAEPLYYRPPVRFAKSEDLSRKLGFSLAEMEQSPIVLAGTYDQALEEPTPVAETGLHKGCRILAVNGESVRDWATLVERFRENAGSTVELTYDAGAGEAFQTTEMEIPHSLSTLLDLPSFSQSYQQISFLLDGKTDVKISLPDPKTGETIQDVLPAHHWLVIRNYLESRIGETVEVTYKDDDGQMVTRTLKVTAEMIDPWYRRVTYSIPILMLKELRYLNRKINPFAAIWAGTRETYYFVAKTYLTLKRLIFTRSVGLEHMSGPVGIINIGAKMAEYDKVELLYFLALISANLAVINFLPLPIVDGGLMVFLMIEKIKGSPVSIRTQVITQMVGIALLGFMFLWITYQDIAKIVG